MALTAEVRQTIRSVIAQYSVDTPPWVTRAQLLQWLHDALDTLDQAEQRIDSLSNTLDDERAHSESLQVALNEKTAELERLRKVLKQIYVQHPETTLALMMAVGISEP